jgi:hypothetical protein
LQRDVAAGHDRRQRCDAVCISGARDGRLDPDEADIAAILQTKRARIDDLGDVALALRLERASRGDAGPAAATSMRPQSAIADALFFCFDAVSQCEPVSTEPVIGRAFA